jgi:dihydrofolate synthase/folylpolyglutamate synthase
LERYGNPERSFATIHIVGTNGKGSTAAFLSAILTAAGYRTGLFTSPHLINYSERFRVNDSAIQPERLDGLISNLLGNASPEDTFFELTTALACCYFAESKVQIAILEAGMGGRSDATAAVPGNLTIITPISLDHCQWLGNSLQAIATEKIAIAPAGSPVIAANQAAEVLAVIKEYCHTHGNQLILKDRDFTASTDSDTNIRYTSTIDTLYGLFPSLRGKHQTGNAALALAAAEQCTTFGFSVSRQAMQTGIASAYWPGRMELIRLADGTELLLDGAHNPAGSQALAEALTEFGNREIILLIGLMEDKDLHGVLQPLLHLAQKVITVTPNQERAVPDHLLATACTTLGTPAQAAGSVTAGLATARTTAKPGDLIVVAGSLFLVGELKAVLAGIPCEAVRG